MGGFCAEVWEATAETRAAIDELPFVKGLADGSLERDRFEYYMVQDALYLHGYARALASTAARADRSEEIAFYAKSAHECIVVESALHEGNVGSVEGAKPSPTGTAYVSYLQSLAQTGGYAELAAGVLPCFWVYMDVGSRLMEKAGDLAGHPYGDWISTYADEAFAESTRKACEITDAIAGRSDAPTVARMREAFARATTYEWKFWDAAWKKETWPFGG
ncbi:TenA family protein [Nocardiopsis sp. RSe5-2]|uniref:TenA family protein n=1 Tax=Nocardiopsis endophytica TaxID=3018445 RepID=A0ABT4UBQ0_9ACTN|nr:TenA family protein [Nocardiopsis endophytica]MDA2814404.1 TenA family protein [Nocardiopsis endophytica]